MASARKLKTRSGFTMAEVMISTLLVGFVLVGALTLLGSALKTNGLTLDLVDGPLLAEDLLAEIMSLPYEDPENADGTIGREGGESSLSRTDWDDVDDYHDWSTSTPQTRGAVALSNYAGWSRSAEVVFADPSSGENSGGADEGLKRISVTVASPSGVVTTRHAYRSRGGMLEQEPPVDRVVVTELGSTLVTGSGSRTISQSSSVLNHVADPNEN